MTAAPTVFPTATVPEELQDRRQVESRSRSRDRDTRRAAGTHEGSPSSSSLKGKSSHDEGMKEFSLSTERREETGVM